jgi:uncharacterized protein DUF2786
MEKATMNESKTKALLEKIRKLKAKADDPGTTEEESMAFAAKVAELLAEHGLEEAQLEIKDQDGLTHEDQLVNWSASPWRRSLVCAICALYMVTPLTAQKGKKWTLVGRPANIIMVKEMATYLIKTTLRLSNQYGKEHPGAHVIDFRRGCFSRLTQRILELKRQQAAQAAPQYSPSGNPQNLPALYTNETNLMNMYITATWGKVKASRSGKLRFQGADAYAGMQAGDSISLNQQIGGGRSNHLIGGRK